MMLHVSPCQFKWLSPAASRQAVVRLHFLWADTSLKKQPGSEWAAAARRPLANGGTGPRVPVCPSGCWGPTAAQMEIYVTVGHNYLQLEPHKILFEGIRAHGWVELWGDIES